MRAIVSICINAFFFFEKKCETFTNNIYILALLMMMCYQVLIVGLCFDVDTGVFSYGVVTTMMLENLF
jgi:hypothetical protein